MVRPMSVIERFSIMLSWKDDGQLGGNTRDACGSETEGFATADPLR